jgi:hypothetical protein
MFVVIYTNRYLFILICPYIDYAKNTYYPRKDYSVVGTN